MVNSELSPYQKMANALAGYQRIVAENEIREQEDIEVRSWWQVCGEMVDGFDNLSPDGKMDPAQYKEFIDDLTCRLGGIVCEVGRDMSITKKDLLELSFRDDMEIVVSTRIQDTKNTLAYRRQLSEKFGIQEPITSLSWDDVFSAHMSERAGSGELLDELSARRDKRLRLQDEHWPLPTDEELDQLEADFNRGKFMVITGGQQPTDEH